MSKTHPIDELFQGLKEYEMSPPMHLWDAIDQKRKRPKMAFWWFKKYGLLLSIGLILLASGGMFLLSPFQAKVPELQHFPILLDDEPSLAHENGPKMEEEQTRFWVPPIGEQEEQGTIIRSSNAPPTNSNNPDFNNANNFSTNVLTQTPGVASTLTPFTPPSSAKETVESEKASIPIALKAEKETQQIREVLTESRTEWTNLPSLPFGPVAFLEESVLSDQQPTWMAWSNVTGNGIVYYFEAFGSPGFASRSLAPVNESFSLLTEEWSAAQQKQSAVQFGLRVAAVNRKGWSLRTGVHFTQIQESFQFVNHIAEVAQIYDPDGGFFREDTIFIPSGAVTNSDAQFALLDLPLILGYQKRYQRWTFSAHAGPILNLSFQPKGTLINPNRQLIPVEAPEAQSAFRSTLGINWYGSLGIQYELQPGVHLMLEPHLRFQRTSFMEAGFPVQQKFLTGGLSVGVRKQLIR